MAAKQKLSGSWIEKGVYRYSEVMAELKRALKENGFQYAVRFSKSTASIYVIAEKNSNIIRVRVADHRSRVDDNDISLHPREILAGKLDGRLQTLAV